MRIANSRIIAGKIKAVIIIFIGAALLLFFAICTAACFDLGKSEEESYIAPLIVCLCFDALGAWLIYRGARKSRLIQDCKRYAGALTSSTAVTVGNLSSVLGENPGKVRAQLDKMIRLGYLEEVYVDNSSDRIVFLGEQRMEPMENLPFNGKSKTVVKRQETVSVTCPACGGVTILPLHESGICDYCGSKIQG